MATGSSGVYVCTHRLGPTEAGRNRAGEGRKLASSSFWGRKRNLVIIEEEEQLLPLWILLLLEPKKALAAAILGDSCQFDNDGDRGELGACVEKPLCCSDLAPSADY